MYGDKRLTPLFQDYTKEKSSLHNEYLKYVTKYDNSELDIIDSDLTESPLFQSGDNATQEELKMNHHVFTMDLINYYIKSDKGMTKNHKITNPDFVILTNLKNNPDYINVTDEMNSILKSIKNNGFITNYNC